jgi:hypothetical protein
MCVERVRMALEYMETISEYQLTRVKSRGYKPPLYIYQLTRVKSRVFISIDSCEVSCVYIN